MKSELYERIYKEYGSKVMGYIRSHINNYSDAEDLHSDVFMKVFDKLDSFDSSASSISTWVYTITRNTVIDYYRTHRITEEIPEDMAVDNDFEQDMINEESLSALADALSELPEELRDIVVLKYYKNYSLHKIADMMQMSYGMVKIRHNKALEILKGTMSDYR